MEKLIKSILIIMLLVGINKSIIYNIELNQYFKANNLESTIENAKEFDKLKGYKTIYLD